MVLGISRDTVNGPEEVSGEVSVTVPTPGRSGAGGVQPFDVIKQKKHVRQAGNRD